MHFGLFLVVFVLYGVHAARILGIFPIPGRSHFTFCGTIMKELASRGHQVTVLSPFPQKSPIPNYTDIDTRTTREDFFQQAGTVLNASYMVFKEASNKVPTDVTVPEKSL
jgi:glucuronosyltransferase